MFFVTKKNKFFHAPSSDSVLIYSEVTGLYAITNISTYSHERYHSNLTDYPHNCYLAMEGKIPFLYPYDYRFVKIQYTHPSSKNTCEQRNNEKVEIISYYDHRLWKNQKVKNPDFSNLISYERQKITCLYNKNYLNYENKIPVCCKGVCFWIDSIYIKEETLWKRIQKTLK